MWSPLIQLAKDLALWVAGLLPVIQLPWTPDLSAFASFSAAAVDLINVIVPVWALLAVLLLWLALLAVDFGWGLLMAAWRRLPILGR